MGGKDAIIVDRECDLDQAVLGVLYSAFGYQGQKCSACSRAIVDESVYDEFLDKLKSKVEALTLGPSDDVANYMGPVISSRAKESILNYIETGKKEGRLVAGGRPVEGEGYFIKPTVIADVEPKHVFSRKRSSALFWRSRKQRISTTRCNSLTIPITA